MHTPAAPDDVPRGCGWFESSHELQHGLEITELDDARLWAAALPLAEWLALHGACGPSGLRLA